MIDKYILALESFETDTKNIYADYLMGQMVATEGLGSSIATKIANGWETIKRLAMNIFKWLRDAAVGVGKAVGSMLGIVRRTDDTIEVDESDSATVAGAVKDLNDLMTKFEDDTSKCADMLRECESAFEELSRMNSEQEAQLDELEKQADEAMKIVMDMMTPEDRAQFQKIIDDLHSGSSAAEDSFTIATEAGGTRKINIGSIKAKFSKLGERSKNGETASANLTGKINSMIDRLKSQSKSEDGSDTKTETTKQRIISKLLRIVSAIGRFFRDIPAMIQRAMKALFKNRTKVVAYDGPSPEIG